MTINGDKRYDEGEVLIANRLNDDKIDSILFLNSMPAIIIIINLNSSFVITRWLYANIKSRREKKPATYLLLHFIEFVILQIIYNNSTAEFEKEFFTKD